jgi:hypothetical protein
MTALLGRRWQTLPENARCNRHGCTWISSGTDAEAEAAAHTQRTGHETRTVVARQVIITPKVTA